MWQCVRSSKRERENFAFNDNYLEEPYDLSNVFFIATANYLENIPAPLRDRMEIVQLSSYTEFEKYEIAVRHLIDKQLIANGLSKCDFELSEGAIWRLIREYTREAGVRELERLIGSLVRKAIKSILMKENVKVVITEENLEEWLGKPKYEYSKLDGVDQVGVVTGLAYTQFGGDTLSTNVALAESKGYTVIAGINGSPFDTSNGVTVGTLISNGIIISAKSGKSGYDSFAIRKDGSMFISTSDLTFKYTTDAGKEINVNYINKQKKTKEYKYTVYQCFVKFIFSYTFIK